MTSTLTISNRNPSNPINEFFKDFERGFFNFNSIFDLNTTEPIFKPLPLVIDRTGFPRANVRNISTFEDDKLEIKLALPGWNEENSKIDLYITEGILEVFGKKEPEVLDNVDKPNCFGKEYERNISLKNNFTWKHCVPEDAEFESYTLKDGLLTVVVKVPNKKPKPKTASLGTNNLDI